MAFQFYPFGYAEILRGNIDLLNDTISYLSVRSGYSFSAAHEDLADITSTLRDAHAKVDLSTKQINDTNAAFTADDISIPAGSGSECNAALIYKHTGTDSTATLIGYFSGAPYTYTPSAATHTMVWAGDVFRFAPTGNLYDRGMAEIARTNIDLLNDTIKAVLIDEADYTFSQSHEDLDDVAGGSIVGTAVALGTKTVSDAGVFDSATVTLSSVSGDATEAVLLYLDSGSSATSTLIAYYTNAEVEVTPNGSDINILVPNGWIDLG